MNKYLVYFFLLSSFSLLPSAHAAQEDTKLQTYIDVYAASPHHGDERNIQPGTPMHLRALVKNIGTKKNASGEIFIRFAFPDPLHNQKSSVLYQSETKQIPPITPGEEIEVVFEKTHRWPSLFDFIRHDWAMRNYEAVIKVGEEEQITGRLTIAFSASYYEGPSKVEPQSVPAE